MAFLAKLKSMRMQMSFTITSMLETRNHALAIAKQMTTRPAPIPDHHADCFIGNHLLLQEQEDPVTKSKTRRCQASEPTEIIFNMKYHLVYASDCEHKILEIDTNDIPPNRGDLVQLPFGENKETHQYRA